MARPRHSAQKTLSIALGGITTPLVLPVPENVRAALLKREDLREEGVPIPHQVKLLWTEPMIEQEVGRQQRLTDAANGPALLDAVTDLVMEFVTDDTDRRVVRTMVGSSTPSGLFQLQSFLLSGQVPDPKAHGELTKKITARVMEQLLPQI